MTEQLDPCTLDEAREAADAWARDGSYDDESSTVWVEIQILDPARYEPRADSVRDAIEETVTVQIDPRAPRCAEGRAREHEWISPIEIVGGIPENPGVWGHGGGVVITEVCAHCGCARKNDTWAQDHSGRQGLTSISYDEDRLVERWRAWRDAQAGG